MMKLLLFFLIFFTYSFSRFVVNSKIDFDKEVLQLGSFKDKLNVEHINSINDNKFDMCVKKTIDGQYYIVYAVNIDTKNKNKIKSIFQKKYKDAFFVFISSCNSVYNKASINKKSISRYDIALNSFKNKNYEKSYYLFNNLFNQDNTNFHANFYLGRSAFELKNYEKALSAYYKFLVQKPNSIRVQLELARTLFYQKNYEESEQLFIKIKEEKLPKSVIKKIDYYLVLIDNNI
jgi:tetratricopeptide (TPR) repeat protein